MHGWRVGGAHAQGSAGGKGAQGQKWVATLLHPPTALLAAAPPANSEPPPHHCHRQRGSTKFRATNGQLASQPDEPAVWPPQQPTQKQPHPQSSPPKGTRLQYGRRKNPTPKPPPPTNRWPRISGQGTRLQYGHLRHHVPRHLLQRCAHVASLQIGAAGGQDLRARVLPRRHQQTHRFLPLPAQQRTPDPAHAGLGKRAWACPSISCAQ